MTVEAEVIADSVNTADERITTMRLRYPLFIHAEFMTHRVFSRNARSGRAVPVERMIQEVLNDPAMPVRFGKHKPGMQDDGEWGRRVESPWDDEKYSAKQVWKHASRDAVRFASRFHAAGYSKQVVNRLLDPFRHIDVIVTATEWDNFFTLRRHEAADPTMYALADAMWDVRKESEPRVLHRGDWHIPMARTRIVSVARCARISYGRSEERTASDDQRLYDTLRTSGHWSPFEHQAQAKPGERHRNFQGWRPFRAILDS